jgi:hypothetical protein
MPRCHLSYGLLTFALVVLGGCASTRYQNASHPGYGDTEYKQDLSQCRGENSTVVTSQGYDVQSQVRVDEAKAQSCMAARGWQAVSK